MRTGWAGGRDLRTIYGARFRPWVQPAQRMARRNVHLFAPANRFQPVARGAVLRLAARPFFAPVVRRLLNRAGNRPCSS